MNTKVLNLLVVLTLVFSMVFVIIPMSKEPVSALDVSSWQYCKKITLTNPNDDQHYRLNISKTSGGDVNCGGHCNNNFSDLRLMRTGNTSYIPLFYDYVNSGTNAVVWFCNKDNDTTLYLYYGNTAAALLDEPSKVWQFWEDWRTTNYLSSYTTVSAANQEAKYRDISNSFNLGKMFVMNFSYANAAWTSSTQIDIMGLSDNNVAVEPTIYLGSYKYNDQDDIGGEDANDAIFWGLNRDASGFATTTAYLMNNIENVYLKESCYINSSKALYKLYNNNYVTLYNDKSTTTKLPTDLDYIFYSAYGVSNTRGVHYSTNKLIVYVGSTDNLTISVYTMAVGNFTDDKTTFSYGAETANPTYVGSSIVPSAPVYFEARTQNSSWIQLNWTKGTGADKTVILANDSGYPTLADCIIIYNGTGTVYNHTGLTNNTHWFYRCYSWNNTGSGCYSTTSLRSHDTTMGISIAGINMALLNTTGSYTLDIGNSFVYQEVADDVDDLWGYCTLMVDGLWSTYEEADGNSRYVILNYTAPSLCWNATWMVKDYNVSSSLVVYHNFSVNHSVVSQGYVKLKVEAAWGDSDEVKYYVYYNGGYTKIYMNSDTSRFYEEAVTWYSYGYMVNFTAESQLNLTFNLTHATETHFLSWNMVSGFWDIVLNATGNTSGLVVVDNTVNTSGTNEYAWRPLLGVNGEWWVWVNQTGLGNGTTVNITKVIPMEVRQTNPLVVGGPLLLTGVVMGLIFNRRRRQRKDV
jgi:hypothetical protein